MLEYDNIIIDNVIGIVSEVGNAKFLSDTSFTKLRLKTDLMIWCVEMAPMGDK